HQRTALLRREPEGLASVRCSFGHPGPRLDRHHVLGQKREASIGGPAPPQHRDHRAGIGHQPPWLRKSNKPSGSITATSLFAVCAGPPRCAPTPAEPNGSICPETELTPATRFAVIAKEPRGSLRSTAREVDSAWVP